MKDLTTHFVFRMVLSTRLSIHHVLFGKSQPSGMTMSILFKKHHVLFGKSQPSTTEDPCVCTYILVAVTKIMS
jgi:hypothetical protein